MSFDTMGLAPEILKALQEASYDKPTPIQEKAIPILLSGRDLMGCAQTGTGKTAAFALPILQRLGPRETGRHLRAVILVPTRELAIQVAESIKSYGAHLELVTAAVYGGVPIGPQEKALQRGVDVLVATPGRLFDHMWRANIDYRHTEVLVLDEADRMLDMGFYDDVMAIVREIPTERQSMLFSATLSPEIRALSSGILRDPATVEVAPPSTTVDEVEQIVIRTDGPESKRRLLETLIRDHGMRRALIFTRTKRGASSLSSYLRGRGHSATSIHSDKTQEARVAALEGFREGRVHLLVATDIAARGIDVDGITHVVNFDVPHSPDDYVHRIGRTARAGKRGIAISLVSPIEKKSFDAIERRIGTLRSVDPGQAYNPARDLAVVGGEAIGRNEAVARNTGRGRNEGAARSAGARRNEAAPRNAGVGGNGGSRQSAVRMQPIPPGVVAPYVAGNGNGGGNGNGNGNGAGNGIDGNGNGAAGEKRRRRRRRRSAPDIVDQPMAAQTARRIEKRPAVREESTGAREHLLNRVVARVRTILAASA
jgi:ATP-dependent RNA helicase RhlE